MLPEHQQPQSFLPRTPSPIQSDRPSPEHKTVDRTVADLARRGAAAPSSRSLCRSSSCTPDRRHSLRITPRSERTANLMFASRGRSIRRADGVVAVLPAPMIGESPILPRPSTTAARRVTDEMSPKHSHRSWMVPVVNLTRRASSNGRLNTRRTHTVPGVSSQASAGLNTPSSAASSRGFLGEKVLSLKPFSRELLRTRPTSMMWSCSPSRFRDE